MKRKTASIYIVLAAVLALASGCAPILDALGMRGSDGKDAQALQIQYSTDGSAAWHASYGPSDAYIRTSTDAGATWSAALRFKGVDGATGATGAEGAAGAAGAAGATGPTGPAGAAAPALQIQYSVDGTTAWHIAYATGDSYLRMSVDGGNAWGAAILFKGADGAAGATGATGPGAASVYLTDANGNRLYSGATLYLGWATPPFGTDPTVTTLSIFNATASTLTLTGINTLSGYFKPQGGGFPSFSYPSEITLSGLPTFPATIPPNSSIGFSITLDYISANGEGRRRFEILLDDGSNSYDFLLDTYGEVTSNSY